MSSTRLIRALLTLIKLQPIRLFRFINIAIIGWIPIIANAGIQVIYEFDSSGNIMARDIAEIRKLYKSRQQRSLVLEEVKTLNDINISVGPNPTNGILYIQIHDEFECGKLSIMNNSGAELVNLSLEKEMELNIENYPIGIYFIIVEIENGFHSFKIIKD